MDIVDAARKVFTFDEGCKHSPYQDTKGNWTIGIGRLIGDSIYDLKLSNHIIDELFKEDLNRATTEAVLVLGTKCFYDQPPARKLAILTLFFTMGGDKVSEQFENTIAAMKRDDWEDVANRVFTWKWAKDVDPKQRPGEGRDDRVAFMFRFGEFHPDYGVKE